MSERDERVEAAAQALCAWPSVAVDDRTHDTATHMARAALAAADAVQDEVKPTWRKVEGTCPACGVRSLMLYDHGHVTCSYLPCPNPSAVDDLLHAP